MKELILHGGEGSRLRPLSSEIPKGFIPICNISSVERMTRHQSLSGGKDVTIVVPSGDTKILELIKKKNLLFKTIKANKYAMLSVVKALEKYDEPILVLWGDTVMSLDMLSMVKHHKNTYSSATMVLWHTTFLRELKHWGSVVFNSDGFTIDHPVPETRSEGYIKAGAFIFNPSKAKRIRRIADENWDMSKILNTMIYMNEFQGFPFEGYRVNINYGSDLLKAMRMILNHEGNAGGCVMGRGVSIMGHTEITSNVSIGDDVTIMNGVHVSNSIILTNSVIEENTTIVDSIIGPSSRIPKDTFVRRKMIVKDISVDLSENNY